MVVMLTAEMLTAVMPMVVMLTAAMPMAVTRNNGGQTFTTGYCSIGHPPARSACHVMGPLPLAS
jgi:hypothetical protein